MFPCPQCGRRQDIAAWLREGVGSCRSLVPNTAKMQNYCGRSAPCGRTSSLRAEGRTRYARADDATPDAADGEHGRPRSSVGRVSASCRAVRDHRGVPRCRASGRACVHPAASLAAICCIAGRRSSGSMPDGARTQTSAATLRELQPGITDDEIERDRGPCTMLASRACQSASGLGCRP
jgi:hypothetical protein